MPTLTNALDRHVTIDQRQGHYLCFPDIAHSGDGGLLCAYNEFDKHVGSRRRLLLKRSEDGGRTWSPAQMLNAQSSHCPRITRMADGLLLMSDDSLNGFYCSTDFGRTWAEQPNAGIAQHGLIDHVVELDHETLLSAAHMHRGSHPQPKIRQAPTEQMAYISRNRGRNWTMHAIIANEKCLVLCEASLIRLPPCDNAHNDDAPPSLLALMRENSHVGEPMYACISNDGGNTWGPPHPTPLIGHRPTLGWTASGKLLVTYRDVGPDPGTKAWLGTLDELLSDFAVHGLHPSPEALRLTPEGLHMQCGAGPESAVRYVLRPVTDPEFATASLEAEVLVREAAPQSCGIRLGQWWCLQPEGVVPLQPPAPGDEEPTPRDLVPYSKGQRHTIRVDYEPGLCRLIIDGEHRGDYPVAASSVISRPILAGAISSRTPERCDVLWQRLSLCTSEPRMGRDYAWNWRHTDGALPDAWCDARVLELRNDRQANPADFGYSGWVELPGPDTGNGEFFCVYHHGGGSDENYREGYSAHVLGTRFYESDF